MKVLFKRKTEDSYSCGSTVIQESVTIGDVAFYMLYANEKQHCLATKKDLKKLLKILTTMQGEGVI